MQRRLWELLDIISKNQYKTASQLGSLLGVSEKTVRTRIKELNTEIENQGAFVATMPRCGYFLQISNAETWDEFLKGSDREVQEVPGDSEERIDYILASFLNRAEYLKIEELIEFLFVSGKTLSNELKKAEYILNRFDLTIERKPYYGMRLKGSEFNKRRCIICHFIMPNKPMWKIRGQQEELTLITAQILKELINEYQLHFSETSFQNTVLYIVVSISRMRKGMYIEEEAAEEDRKEMVVSQKLFECLAERVRIEPTRAEIQYTAIYIAGKRFMDNRSSGGDNFIISEKTDRLVMNILDSIYEIYKVELRNNLNLRMMLNQHMVPLEIRLKYGISTASIDIKEIKEKYVFAYTMAQQAASVISEFYQKIMPEDEIKCLAVYFALALEEKKSKEKEKKNILLVCVSGKASSQMLMYRFRQEFGEYINSLEICGMYDFEKYDLSHIDFIFSTVPIYRKVNVPIMEIREFLEGADIMSVRNVLQIGDFDFLDDFYKEKYFFANIKANTKEDAIAQISERIRKETELPQEFEESVLLRESYGATDFGNFVAIPHPCKMLTDETIIAVAILEEPILWTSKMVQVIILTALSKNETDDVQKFYEITTKFLVNSEAVQELIELPTFEHLRMILQEISTK